MKSEKNRECAFTHFSFRANVCALRGQCWRTLTGFWPVTTSGGRKKASILNDEGKKIRYQKGVARKELR
ncbi:hypothetical protein [Veillonella magna]|uniref:hypothetical protein n=1 Tax=Veillonella magna TaxID=464322 RepID=UPI0019601622|nr:hypothetical protein [Veillonella magna]